MTYTIKIEDTSPQAKSIINMLKAFEDEFNFIEIKEGKKSKVQDDIDNELEIRYKLFQKNPTGKEWSILKSELLKK